jgi:hypothetical protein
MTTKQYWHKSWKRDGTVLLHSSGFKALQADGGTWVACLDSYPRWLAFEHTQGVPAHQLHERQARLLKEAAMWRDSADRRQDLLAKRVPPKARPQTQKSPAPTTT